MRKVFSSTSEVIHVWAQDIQTEGRAGNVFFSDNILYSYGYHYELARFITLKDGSKAVMINDIGYSSSTSNHISETLSATNHLTQIRATHLDHKHVLGEMRKFANSLANARKPEIYIDGAESLWYYYIKAHEAIGKPYKQKTGYYEIKRIHEGILEGKNGEYAEAIRKQRERAKAKKKRDDKVKVREFMNYERSRASLDQDVLRVSRCGDFVETSQNIRVDIEDARILFRLIKAGRNIRGHKIGYYTVTSINGTLKIGCHNINMASVKSIGNQIIKS